MKHVIAFDVSIGKSYMVVYNALKKCEVEKEMEHTRPVFVPILPYNLRESGIFALQEFL